MSEPSSTSQPFAGAVIAYNPSSADISRIMRLARNLPLLIAADNSEPPVTPVDGIDWIPMGGNKGVGAALNACCLRADSLGYRWLLALDQDTELSAESISTYLRAFATLEDKDSAAVVTPRLDENDKPTHGEEKVRDLVLAMTSCSFLNLEAWSKIGGFAEQLFIDEVDHEYCLNAKRHGYRVVRLMDALVAHQPGQLKEVRTNRGAAHMTWHPPDRLYYIARNYWYLRRQYASDFPEVVAERGNQVWIKYKEHLRFHPQKIRSLWALFKGTLHGLFGRYGKA